MENTLKVTTHVNTYSLESNGGTGVGAWGTLSAMRSNAKLLIRAIQVEMSKDGLDDDQRVWLLETRNKAANVCEDVWKAKAALTCSLVTGGVSQYTSQALETYLEMKAYTYNLVCVLSPANRGQVEYAL